MAWDTYRFHTYDWNTYGLDTYGLDPYGLDTYCLDTYDLDTYGLDTYISHPYHMKCLCLGSSAARVSYLYLYVSGFAQRHTKSIKRHRETSAGKHAMQHAA